MDLKEIEEIEAFKKSVEVFTNRIALIFGNGAGPFASWGNIRLCQEMALEGTCKANR